MTTAAKRPIKLVLAAPRGFCAGVVRAIDIVERALERYGAPVYVRHEIVHNRYVVDDLKAKGAVFVEELDECPTATGRWFSRPMACPRRCRQQARLRQLFYLDATCPLVSKVHMEAERHLEDGCRSC